MTQTSGFGQRSAQIAVLCAQALPPLPAPDGSTPPSKLPVRKSKGWRIVDIGCCSLNALGLPLMLGLIAFMGLRLRGGRGAS